MEADPFAVIEAMTIAALATGCAQGYLYIRGEYPEAQYRLTTAIAQARARGFLGPQVMGHAFQFDIELRRGAGAYICGEETALMNSIEGYRGELRNKRPDTVGEPQDRFLLSYTESLNGSAQSEQKRLNSRSLSLA